MSSHRTGTGNMEWIEADDNSDSPFDDEASNGSNVAGSSGLKKGPWTSTEDAILVDYVTKNGEGNWNAVQKFSGLYRCGKSCRLRWVNHLRPDLKKGTFSPEEERRIIELHAMLGNKWARMAAELPGRTDNEIKNFWNTRNKRLQRAGLPIYPPDLCLQQLSESQQTQDSGTFSTAHAGHHNFMEASDLVLPDFKIEGPVNPELYSSPFLDIATRNMLSQGPVCGYSCMPQSIPPQKRLGGPDYDFHTDSSSRFYPGSHAFINGNSSTPEPNFWSLELELPSLQSSQSHLSYWGSSLSPLPPLESNDTLEQSPPTMPYRLEASPETDGLLESVVCPPKRLMTSKAEPSRKTYQNGKTTHSSACDDGAYNFFNSSDSELEACVDPTSPLGCSTATIFSELTPLGGSSPNEPQSMDAILGSKARTQSSVSSTYQKHYNKEVDPSRPDTWFDADWLSPDSEQGKEYLMMQEAISLICEEDTQLLAPAQPF